jgi:hypothetical protein
MTADFFDAAQLQSVLDGKPVLVTAEQLGALFSLDEDEIYELARRGLMARVGELFDARLSTQQYCEHLRSIAPH